VPKPPLGNREEPPIGRDPEQRLRHAQRDDLGIRQAALGVLRSIRQEIVGRAEHGNQQQVEVGEHRGPPEGRRRLVSTADFDHCRYVPFPTAPAVESLI
jgi:hypothetical protein